VVRVAYIRLEGAMPRRIFTDGRDFSQWPKPGTEPALVGYSIGSAAKSGNGLAAS
jgi:hypothetical protein